MEQVTKNSMYGRLPDILRNSTDKRCGGWWANPFADGGWSYCALGTVARQMGANPLSIVLPIYSRKQMADFCGIDRNVTKTKMQCTECGKGKEFWALIAHNNDKHKMSFHENADAIEKAVPYVRPKKD